MNLPKNCSKRFYVLGIGILFLEVGMVGRIFWGGVSFEVHDKKIRRAREAAEIELHEKQLGCFVFKH